MDYYSTSEKTEASRSKHFYNKFEIKNEFSLDPIRVESFLDVCLGA